MTSNGGSLALKWEGDRFQQLYVNPVTRLSRFLFQLMVISFLEGVVKIITCLLWLVRAFLLLLMRQTIWTCQIAKAVSEKTLIRPTIASGQLLSRAISAVIATWRGEERYVPVPKEAR